MIPGGCLGGDCHVTLVQYVFVLIVALACVASWSRVYRYLVLHFSYCLIPQHTQCIIPIVSLASGNGSARYRRNRWAAVRSEQVLA